MEEQRRLEETVKSWSKYWKCYMDPRSQRPFYYNLLTSEKTWIRPPDFSKAAKAARPAIKRARKRARQQLKKDLKEAGVSEVLQEKAYARAQREIQNAEDGAVDLKCDSSAAGMENEDVELYEGSKVTIVVYSNKWIIATERGRIQKVHDDDDPVLR